MSNDTLSMAGGFALIFGGGAILSGGALVGIGIGGYFLGAAIGLVGTAAFFAGVGIIIGGLAVLAGLGYGIYAIVDHCLQKRDAARARQQALIQQDLNDLDAKKTVATTDSTKSILLATASEPTAPVEKTVETAAPAPVIAPVEPPLLAPQQPQPQPSSPSLFSRILSFFWSSNPAPETPANAATNGMNLHNN